MRHKKRVYELAEKLNCEVDENFDSHSNQDFVYVTTPNGYSFNGDLHSFVGHAQRGIKGASKEMWDDLYERMVFEPPCACDPKCDCRLMK